MSKDWTKEELARASEVMKANGFMSLEEFCEALDRCDKLAYGIDHEELEHRKMILRSKGRLLPFWTAGRSVEHKALFRTFGYGMVAINYCFRYLQALY